MSPCEIISKNSIGKSLSLGLNYYQSSQIPSKFTSLTGQPICRLLLVNCDFTVV